MKSGSIAVVAAVFLAAVLLAACGRDETVPPPEGPPPPLTAEPFRTLHLRTPDNQLVVTFRWSSEEVQIHIGEGDNKRFLRSRLEQNRQRRYNERGVGPVALVRTNSQANSFNIRSMEGELWLRVRLGKKIAVVADSQDQPYFDLLRPKDHVVRVVDTDRNEIGRAVFRKARARIFDSQGALLYKTDKGAPKSLLYGVLTVPDLDPVTRYILMAELLVRGR